MARHIMAVCVVCLLCAEHLPCQQHFTDALSNNTHAHLQYEQLNAKVFERTDAFIDPSTQVTTESYTLKNNNDNKHDTNYRRKRHAGHVHSKQTDAHTPQITQNFLQRILDEQGTKDNHHIGVADLHRILQQLGLQQLLDGQNTENKHCMNDVQLVNLLQTNSKLSQNLTSAIVENCLQHGNGTKDCAFALATNASTSHRRQNVTYKLDLEDVLNICPVLLHQLITLKTPKYNGCLNADEFATSNKATESHLRDNDEILYVWIYAFISVFACGILGLVGVAIIPFMDSRYYKHIIQFLVSLAVGTMTGDALLHLLPHSLQGQTTHNMVFKGLTCMGGIIFFYITEHGLTMISEWRKRIVKQETKNPSRAKVMRDPHSAIQNSVTGDKLCKSKYSSYPYCYDEIAMDTKKDVWLHLPQNSAQTETRDAIKNVERKRNSKVLLDPTEHAAAQQSLLATSENNYAPIAAELNHQNHVHNPKHNQHQLLHEQQQLPDSNTISTDLDGNLVGEHNGALALSNNGNYKDAKDPVTVILREHESSHHGHSHKHGHVHSPPESLSAVAWMIIMGDGLHNFTDGMAIGAAFAETLAGGFSTSLAVFCHELPHELGDFAILIKAGMSVKSAVYYNLLTGVLSFVGMVVGILFGQSPETAQWMFAAAAGLFIYIALVDMMPELSAAHKTLEQFVLQILGMSTGVLLMLVIAICEDDLMNVFSSTSSADHAL